MEAKSPLPESLESYPFMRQHLATECKTIKDFRITYDTCLNGKRNNIRSPFWKQLTWERAIINTSQ